MHRHACPLLLALLVAASLPSGHLVSKTNPSAPRVDTSKSAESERAPFRLPQLYENLKNDSANVETYSSNYGILFLNVSAGTTGAFWPRGSNAPYLFGGGVWFGAKKIIPGRGLRKLSVISYNPNSGGSWMIPGTVTEPESNVRLDSSWDGINRNRLYFSTDYDRVTGTPLDTLDVNRGGANWPIWRTNPDEPVAFNRYVGDYVGHLANRDLSTYSGGPAFLSDEDVVAVFNDSELTRYEIGQSRAAEEGYPLGMEFHQRLYGWASGPLKDMLFVRYAVINKSSDTLYDCYLSPAIDPDIGHAANDRTSIMIPNAANDSLNLAVVWSEVEARQYGYLGFDLLETPAVDSEGFLRRDKRVYSAHEQLGMTTFRNWIIEIDPRTPEERYDFMASGLRDGDNGAGDKRLLIATGPFNMLPADTAVITLAILFAMGAGPTPNGSWTDAAPLVDLDLLAQGVFDEGVISSTPRIYGTGSPNLSRRVSGDGNLVIESVRPNPTASEQLTVSLYFEKDLSGEITVQLFDPLGRCHFEKSFGSLPLVAGSYPFSLSLDDVRSGFYYLQVSAAGETSAVPLVVE